jgi:hypothetical protein
MLEKAIVIAPTIAAVRGESKGPRARPLDRAPDAAVVARAGRASAWGSSVGDTKGVCELTGRAAMGMVSDTAPLRYTPCASENVGSAHPGAGL